MHLRNHENSVRNETQKFYSGGVLSYNLAEKSPYSDNKGVSMENSASKGIQLAENSSYRVKSFSDRDLKGMPQQNRAHMR